MTKIVSQRYGKSRVRLSRLDRGHRPARFSELTVDVSLDGDFDAAYTDGDNRQVVATDTMKNTVYVLARESPSEVPEALAQRLARHFRDEYSQVRRVEVSIEEHPWESITAGSSPSPDALSSAGSEVRATRVVLDSESPDEMRSGLRGLRVLKIARSGFSDFHRDRLTTLADTDDRLLGTTIETEWRYGSGEHDWRGERERIRAALLASFAAHDSRSVQETLYSMAEAALSASAAVEEIRLVMPNEHHLLVDLSPFGLDNDNVIFVPTDAPFGSIEATVVR